MAAYPWYTRVLDAAHRLFVVLCVGGTVYMAGGNAWMVYANRKKVQEMKAVPEDELMNEVTSA